MHSTMTSGFTHNLKITEKAELMKLKGTRVDDQLIELIHLQATQLSNPKKEVQTLKQNKPLDKTE